MKNKVLFIFLSDTLNARLIEFEDKPRYLNEPGKHSTTYTYAYI